MAKRKAKEPTVQEYREAPTVWECEVGHRQIVHAGHLPDYVHCVACSFKRLMKEVGVAKDR